MKRIGTFAAALAALTMTAAPALAAAAPSAARLSVAGSRAGAPSDRGNAQTGGGGAFIGLAIAAGIAAIIVLAAINGDDNFDNPASS